MNGRVAAIITAYGERGKRNIDKITAALLAQTRTVDQVWLVTEDMGLGIDLPTPRGEDGRYAVVPYAYKTNYALDRCDADYVFYVTDDSLPDPRKVEVMAGALDEHPDWGAVYCGQVRNGHTYDARETMHDAYCRVDHTQVMHRLTDDRWSLDMRDMRLGDAVFWRKLHASLGPFYPVPEILDYVEQTQEGISATW